MYGIGGIQYSAMSKTISHTVSKRQNFKAVGAVFKKLENCDNLKYFLEYRVKASGRGGILI